MSKNGNLARAVTAAGIAVMLSGGAASAQLAPSLPSPPSLAPSIPQAVPSLTPNIPNIPSAPEAVAAPPAVEAAPYGINRTADGKWSLNPGCHWDYPDDENDLSATCN